MKTCHLGFVLLEDLCVDTITVGTYSDDDAIRYTEYIVKILEFKKRVLSESIVTFFKKLHGYTAGIHAPR